MGSSPSKDGAIPPSPKMEEFKVPPVEVKKDEVNSRQLYLLEQELQQLTS